MSKIAAPQIDGHFLYYAFVAGGKRILQYREYLNRINVFPVYDRDTGSNLASTIGWILDNIKPHKSYKKTVAIIAEAALRGARGNSGVIFAQFLYGVSQETENKSFICLSDFANSLKNSIPYIYKAVANPVEGTMLTVIKEWADYIFSNKCHHNDFRDLLVGSQQILEKSVEATKHSLKVLSQNNFVDAGAKGFSLFIEGVIDFIKNHNIRELLAQPKIDVSPSSEQIKYHVDISYRYCTEAIIRDLKISIPQLRNFLNNWGDSVIVAGSHKLCRVHMHTNSPRKMLWDLKDKGVITYQKVDDMVRQNQTVTNRRWNIALVTDSSCDLPQEIIDLYQIHVVPLNINFGDRHYLDKVTVGGDQFYELLNSKGEFPSTSQINERVFMDLYTHLASHYDAIISVHMTHHFSGTYKNSKMAAYKIASKFSKPVYSIDSHNLSGALGLLVLKTARAIEGGMPLEILKENIEKWRTQLKIFVSVKNLKHMIRSGRVSRPKGIVANWMGVTPIVSMDKNGRSMLFGKSFSQRENMNRIVEHIRKISEGKNIWNYIVLHAHNREGADKYVMKMQQVTGKNPVAVVDISPVIGMFAGPGTTAVSLLYE